MANKACALYAENLNATEKSTEEGETNLLSDFTPIISIHIYNFTDLQVLQVLTKKDGRFYHALTGKCKWRSSGKHGYNYSERSDSCDYKY